MSARSRQVRLSEMHVLSGTGALTAVGLGSCVAVALHDAQRRVAGLAHVLLPDPSAGREASPGRFASTAVPALLHRVEQAGAERAAVRAKLAGGASMFGGLAPNGVAAVGRRNAEAAKKALAELGIPVVAEDLGGNWGRSIHFDVATGRMVVSNVLREDVVL